MGDVTSSTAYFDRIVRETEDQTDFVWGAITSNFGSLPHPGAITEIKDYQRFVELGNKGAKELGFNDMGVSSVDLGLPR